MAKKIVRLTESQLKEIIKKAIVEQSMGDNAKNVVGKNSNWNKIKSDLMKVGRPKTEKSSFISRLLGGASDTLSWDLNRNGMQVYITINSNMDMGIDVVNGQAMGENSNKYGIKVLSIFAKTHGTKIKDGHDGNSYASVKLTKIAPDLVTNTVTNYLKMFFEQGYK